MMYPSIKNMKGCLSLLVGVLSCQFYLIMLPVFSKDMINISQMSLPKPPVIG
jgi:hypothetical protein